MAEKDVLGLAMEQVAGMLGRVRSDMAKRVPYGPLRAKMSAREARLKLQAMEPQAKQAYIQQVGVVEWGKMMEELYG